MSWFSILRPALFAFEEERAHGLAIAALKSGLLPGGAAPDPILRTRVWGLDFPNPIGLAAGFDKNADVPDAILAQGFGFTECGTVTPRPQPGNPRPRLFRLTADRAVINRMGFNNDGVEPFAAKLSARKGRPGIVGANIGANKDAADPAADYCAGLARLAGLADYYVVNISSPNTPGLRALQGRAALESLLARLMDTRGAKGVAAPVLVKVAPDLTPPERADIAEIVLAAKVDGLIVSNTTISRPGNLRDPRRGETGGLSGAPLLDMSTGVLTDFYRLTAGKLPLVGVGGVACGADAYAKIRAGASLVQLYSALVYHGPGLGRIIARDLAALLRRDGFAHVGDAVGADHR